MDRGKIKDPRLEFHILTPGWVGSKELIGNGRMDGRLTDKFNRKAFYGLDEKNRDYQWIQAGIENILLECGHGVDDSHNRACSITEKQYVICAVDKDSGPDDAPIIGFISWQPCHMYGQKINYIRTAAVRPDFEKNSITEKLFAVLFDTYKYEQYLEQKTYQEHNLKRHGAYNINLSTTPIIYLMEGLRGNMCMADTILSDLGFKLTLKYGLKPEDDFKYMLEKEDKRDCTRIPAAIAFDLFDKVHDTGYPPDMFCEV